MKTPALNKVTPENLRPILNDVNSGETDGAIAEKYGIERKEVKSLRVKHNLTEKDLFLKIKQLEKETALFKKLFNELSIENALLKESLNKTQI